MQTVDLAPRKTISAQKAALGRSTTCSISIPSWPEGFPPMFGLNMCALSEVVLNPSSLIGIYAQLCASQASSASV